MEKFNIQKVRCIMDKLKILKSMEKVIYFLVMGLSMWENSIAAKLVAMVHTLLMINLYLQGNGSMDNC